MAALLAGFSNGNWVTRDRVMAVAAIMLAATVLVLGFLAATAHGSVDILGRPLGTDFSSFYAAGKAVLAGDPTAPYNPARQHAAEQALFGADTPFYAWQYPPFFLLVAAPLALLPESWRDVVGKIAVVTLLNAAAVLAYVLVVRRMK